MSDPKILILTIAVDIPKYSHIENRIRQTWGKHNVSNVELIFYTGYHHDYPRPNPAQVIRQGDMLVCGINDNDKGGKHRLIDKTIVAVDYAVNNVECDYIFRTCSGSYVDVAELATFCKTTPRTNVYAGCPLSHIGINYVSGAGILWSKDAAATFAKDAAVAFAKDPNILRTAGEDVSIGDAMQRAGIPIAKFGKRVEIGESYNYEINEGYNTRHEKGSTPRLVRGHYHYHTGARPEYFDDYEALIKQRQLRKS